MSEHEDLALDPVSAEDARAEVAFKDFLLMSPKRSVDGLWKEYCEKAQQLGRHSVPTTHRNTIYRWAKENRWKERAAEHDKRVAQAETRSYDAMRTLRYDNLMELSDSAVKALQQLIESGETPAKTRLDAAKTVLDRVGVTEDLGKTTEPQQKKQDVPDPDADDVTLQKWLAAQRG